MKKKVKYNIFIIKISALLIFTGCEQETIWDIQESRRYVIVDALLTNELRYQTIRVHTSNLDMNENPQPVSGVEILLSDDDGSVSFIEDPTQPGRYYSIYPIRTVAGKIYQLAIHYDTTYDTAYAYMEGITPMEPTVIVPHEDLYRYSYIPSSLPSMMEVYYLWTDVPEFCEYYGECYAAETFYTLDIIDISKEFAPEKEIIAFPEGTMIIRRKYSLNEPHQHFIRSLLLETEWRGGLFDVEQGNVPTNFIHGTRGWFATCMVLMDTAHVY